MDRGKRIRGIVVWNDAVQTHEPLVSETMTWTFHKLLLATNCVGDPSDRPSQLSAKVVWPYPARILSCSGVRCFIIGAALTHSSIRVIDPLATVPMTHEGILSSRSPKVMVRS